MSEKIKSNLDTNTDKYLTKSLFVQTSGLCGINFFLFFENEVVDLERINTETLSIIICLQFSKNLLQA